YRVEYWQGSFVRTEAVETTYLHLLLNRCGMMNDVLLREEIVNRWENPVVFTVENPNLSDEIVASYQLVPMTEAEARVALEEARERCERYQP
ncbi:MAG: hypothetical protein NDJ90_13835, partial [Oligoflexia bacterium]|nr:hypothetical protein [Oligoflexia bacterium]